MAETRLTNNGKKYSKSFSREVTFLRLLRFGFLLSLSLIVVYIYYLHLIGNLQQTLLDIWTTHQKVIISLSILITYSTIIFQLGVWRGRKR
ncbi:hypothetical protein DYI25_05185 [Mesobacillus boroniphilus]|uniref:Uncharacterized protein n=1 Tax=Mesobacillus boroniphilus TaxID=308892 RepID=A0A944CJK2_9BACI|nr:hypothetical protein [Mesobacillus boroniphilus]